MSKNLSPNHLSEIFNGQGSFNTLGHYEHSIPKSLHLLETSKLQLETYCSKLPQHISFIDALEVALKKLSQPDFDTLCTACWLIWNCRNMLIFENKSPSSVDLWSWAELYRLEYVEVQQRNTEAPTRLFPKWQPPPSDSIHKLNLAISQSRNSSSIGVGLLIRNCKGEVSATTCCRPQKNLNPLCTAALVMRMALLFCQSIYFLKLYVECNFAKLMYLLISDRIFSLEVAWILEDVNLFKDSFTFISFRSLLLRCNRAALALVSAAKEE